MTDTETQLAALTGILLGPVVQPVARPCQGRESPALQDVVALARRNVVLVRCGERLEANGHVGAELAGAVAEERRRVAKCVALIAEITQLCDGAGIPIVFPKAFQHYPDMGHDVDVLVGGGADETDQALLDGLGARRTPPGVFDRISGKTGMWRDDWPAPVEVHHARLGQVGEQTGFAAHLLASRRRTTIAGIETWIPSPGDQVLIQAYQRVCCHLSLRVSDVARGRAAVADGVMDWERIWDTARRYGLDGALRVYLAHVAQIAEWAGAAADDSPMPASRNGCYTIPVGSVMAAYAVEIRTLAVGAEWRALGRLATAPLAWVVARSQAVARAAFPATVRDRNRSR